MKLGDIYCRRCGKRQLPPPIATTSSPRQAKLDSMGNPIVAQLTITSFGLMTFYVRDALRFPDN